MRSVTLLAMLTSSLAAASERLPTDREQEEINAALRLDEVRDWAYSPTIVGIEYQFFDSWSPPGIRAAAWFQPVLVYDRLCLALRREASTNISTHATRWRDPYDAYHYWKAETPADCEVEDLSGIPSQTVRVFDVPTADVAEIMHRTDELLLAALEFIMNPPDRFAPSPRLIADFRQQVTDPSTRLRQIQFAHLYLIDFGIIYSAGFHTDEFRTQPTLYFSFEEDRFQVLLMAWEILIN